MIESKRLPQAKIAVAESQVIEKLAPFSPAIVSTIWVGLDADDSDIDIVCEYDTKQAFVETVEKEYSSANKFTLDQNHERVLVQFSQGKYLLEIYACNLPVEQQTAYRHFKVMECLVSLGGKRFQRDVQILKRKGLKTEPAISQLLNLKGDPYQAVLELFDASDDKLTKLLN